MVKTIFNETQLDYIRDNYNNMTYTEMSQLELFNGLDKKQIRNKARVLGISKTRKFDDSYFNKIDTINKAYWLGLIYADGFISFNEQRRNYEFGIELHTDDKYILDQLNDELGGVHKVTSRKKGYYIQWILLCF